MPLRASAIGCPSCRWRLASPRCSMIPCADESFLGLLAYPWVQSEALSAGQGWAETAEGELGESDQRVGGAEAKCTASDQLDLGVERLHATVVDAVKQRGLDVGAVVRDSPGQCHERIDAAASRPLEPALEGPDGVGIVNMEDHPQLLLEQVGAIQRSIELGDQG